jgi:hypothetical protein
MTVDAEQSITDQHLVIRKIFREHEHCGWSERNLPAVADWMSMRRI